jgi:protein TonB
VICALIFLASVLSKLKGSEEPTQILVQDVNLEDIKKEEKKPEPPPPPPPPKIEPPKIEITKFTPPKIVNEEVKEPPPEQEKLEETKIGTINQEGVKTDVVAPPVEQGTGVVEAPKVVEDYDKEFKTVQIQAKFPGGPDAWIKYLQRNLRSDVPVENGAPSGRYTVIVSFLVDKDGNISEVKAEND